MFDISTVARWRGPPSGIDRLQSRLVSAIVARHPKARLAIYSQRRGQYRAVTGAAFELICDPRVVVADDEGPDAADSGPAFLRARRAARHIAVARGELARGAFGWGAAAPLTVPMSAVAGREIAFAPDDVLVDTGAGWEYGISGIAARLKRERRIRYVSMCHDVIPLMFPEWCGDDTRAAFDEHFQGVLRTADAMLFHSRRVAADAAAFAAACGLGPVPSRFVPVGVDRLAPAPAAAVPAVALPAPLASGRFALAVGTIEPRKGHRLLLDVWRRLQVQGIPARHGFVLVFAGKPGWMVDELLGEIRRQAAGDPSFLWLPEVTDGVLDRLYRDAAFCAFPSLYEGYGLPAVEAFAYGKALLCSTGGALPEVAGALCSCIDPGDVEEWTTAFERLIADPAARVAAETKVRAGFKPLSWADAAGRWLAILDEVR